MSPGSETISAILQEATLLLLITGSIFALLLGLLFILAPTQAQLFSIRCSRWVSLRRPTKSLEILRTSEPYIYRHHRTIGLFIILSTTYTLYGLTLNYDHTTTLHILSQLTNNTLIAQWLLNAALWFAVPVSVLLLLFGATMALKPSTLKVIERYANRWISTRRLFQPLETPYNFLDNWVARQPRYFGLLLVMATTYNLSILLLFFINKLK
jgi:hypothetical protein